MADCQPPCLECHVDLASFHTFGIKVKAARMLTLTHVSQLGELAACLQECKDETGDYLLLGGGSNIVFTEDYVGTVVRVACKGRRLVGEDSEAWYVEAQGGEPWHDLVRWTLEQGWPGLERLSLIPGTVGAAPVQNIGAYGLESGEHLHCVDVFSLTERCFLRLTAQDCRLTYRDSFFKSPQAQGLLIVAVTLRLPKKWHLPALYPEVAAALEVTACSSQQLQALALADAITAVRRAKLPDPAQLGNAGSFFKNPVVTRAESARLHQDYPTLPCYVQEKGSVKLAAGWLIEQCGWKGRRLGAVGCYDRQALVLVNHGGAQGDEILRLAATIQTDVRQRFQVELEIEPLLV